MESTPWHSYRLAENAFRYWSDLALCLQHAMLKAGVPPPNRTIPRPPPPPCVPPMPCRMTVEVFVQVMEDARPIIQQVFDNGIALANAAKEAGIGEFDHHPTQLPVAPSGGDSPE